MTCNIIRRTFARTERQIYNGREKKSDRNRTNVFFMEFQSCINIDVACNMSSQNESTYSKLSTLHYHVFREIYNLFISHIMVVSMLYVVHVTFSRNSIISYFVVVVVVVIVVVVSSWMLTTELYTYRVRCNLFRRNCSVMQFSRTMKLLK